MNVKKLFVLHLLMINSIIQPYDFKDTDFKKVATVGLGVSATAFIVYMCATSGDSVEQRVSDAEKDIATMSEYEQAFELDFIFTEKESQIKSNLDKLHIDLNSLNHWIAYDKKLQKDLIVLEKAYNNLWFKSFYGGEEITAIICKVYAYKVKVEAILKYLQVHHKFIEGYQIMNESSRLLSRSALQSQDEIIKAAQNYDVSSLHPLCTYVKKFQKDLECIKFLTTDKKALHDYPQLSGMIMQYQGSLEEIKNAIVSLDVYKQEALSKLEADIALLTEQHKQLAAIVVQLKHEVQMLRMSRR